jgi:thioredoxin reductase (NADPH)
VAKPLTARSESGGLATSAGYVLAARDLVLALEWSGWPLDRDSFHPETSHPGVFVAGDLRHDLSSA